MLHPNQNHLMPLTKNLLLASCLVCLMTPPGGALAADLPPQITFSDKGLSSIQIGATEYLAAGIPRVTSVMDGDGKVVQSPMQSSTFDPATKTVVNTYPWGILRATYQPQENGLGLQVVIENQSDHPISQLAFIPATFQNLGEGRTQQPSFCFEEPTFTFFQGSGGTLVLGIHDRVEPLQLDISVDRKSGHASARVGLGGGKVVGDNVQMLQRIEPGTSADFDLVLRLGPANKPAMDLAADFIQDFREKFPMVLQWPDRRPILRAFIGGKGLPVAEAVANLKNPESVIPPVPDEAFRAEMIKKVEGLIAAAKTADAQAMIIWDIEGNTFPHATTYIGDPRLARLLNPQMDLVADELFKMLKDAGLRTGVTLRPSSVRYDPEKNTAHHRHQGIEPLEELMEKAAYAQKRWGCTVFYVDTNFFWRPYGPEAKWQSARINSDVWRKLHASFPDTLFIPEFTGIADYASVCGYGEADMGDYGVPMVAAAAYPDAFRAIVIEDADASENFDRFLGTLRGRNPLMTFGQGAQNLNTMMIQRMQEWLTLEDSPVPAEVSGATGPALVALLRSPDAPTAFHAARKLAQSPTPEAAPELITLTESEETPWALRRASLLALGENFSPAAVPVLLGVLENRPLGLYGDAARTLVAGDESVDAVVVEKIAELVTQKGMNRGIDRFGSVLVLRQAKAKALDLQQIFATTEERDLFARRDLLAIIGQLRNPESETFLLTILPDPETGPAAGAALVRVGTPSGLEAVRKAQKDAQEAGNKELAGAYGRSLQAK